MSEKLGQRYCILMLVIMVVLGEKMFSEVVLDIKSLTNGKRPTIFSVRLFHFLGSVDHNRKSLSGGAGVLYMGWPGGGRD